VLTLPISTALCYPLLAQIDGLTIVLAAKRMRPQEPAWAPLECGHPHRRGEAGSVPTVFGGVARHLRSYPIPGRKVQIQLRSRCAEVGTADCCLVSQGVAKT
jgi:hypothetical protein